MSLFISDENLCTPAELASKLKISRKMVYYYTRRGELPCIRLGKHIRYRYSDVWASACRPAAAFVEMDRTQLALAANRSLKTQTGNPAPSRKE